MTTSSAAPAEATVPSAPARVGNAFGIIGLIFAGLGILAGAVPFIFTDSLLVGFVLFAVATPTAAALFVIGAILAVVGLLRRGRKRGTSIAALVVSVLGLVAAGLAYAQVSGVLGSPL